MKHIVWDWNCTLLNDFAISVEAAAVACSEVGGRVIGADEYRMHFTRPVRSFYESLLDRPVSDAEWRRIADLYHLEYRRRIPSVGLRGDAVSALTLARDSGVTQSLLSMGEHDDVMRMVDAFGLLPYFQVVQGADVGHRTEAKSLLLARHLETVYAEAASRPRPEEVLLIGDTQDDAETALGAGARCALLSDGCFDPAIAADPGVALVDTLEAAVRSAFLVWDGR